jgi:flavodoxin
LKNSILRISLIFVFLFSFIFFAVQADLGKEDKVLVVFYSRTGTTKGVAENIAQELGADIQELIDTKKRTGPVAIHTAGRDARVGNLTELEPLEVNLDEYSTIIIGTPNWWGNITPAIRTFILENDLSGKKIGIFGTTNLTGIQSALEQAVELVQKENRQEIPLLGLRSRDLDQDILSQKIKEFIEKLK